jgi:hypothetical protein
MADRVRYPAAVEDRVRHLAQNLPDGDIADGLNQEGQISALGKPFTASMIKWIPLSKQCQHAVRQLSGLNRLARRCLCLRFAVRLAAHFARLEVERFLLSRRALSSLQHTGLSRRTLIPALPYPRVKPLQCTAASQNQNSKNHPF